MENTISEIGEIYMFEHLKGRVPKYIDEDKMRQSAVMIALIKKDGVYHVLFEVRASHLKHQPGEICLPGGIREPGETAMENAVRETTEELLISPSQIEVIAQLDTLINVANIKLDVFLCELHDYDMTYSKEEVEEIFTVPLNFFLYTKPEVYQNEVKTIPPDDFPFDRIPGGKNYPWRSAHRDIYFYYYKDKVIWGMTAYILQHSASLFLDSSTKKE